MSWEFDIYIYIYINNIEIVLDDGKSRDLYVE